MLSVSMLFGLSCCSGLGRAGPGHCKKAWNGMPGCIGNPYYANREKPLWQGLFLNYGLKGTENALGGDRRVVRDRSLYDLFSSYTF